jgi:hypothetical protein
MVRRAAHGVLWYIRGAERCAQRLPHLTAHDLAEIDVEVRAALTELGNGTG